MTAQAGIQPQEAGQVREASYGSGFFVVFGLGALVLVLAWVLPGQAGMLLRRPIVSILIIGAILIMVSLTVWMGLASRGW